MTWNSDGDQFTDTEQAVTVGQCSSLSPRTAWLSILFVSTLYASLLLGGGLFVRVVLDARISAEQSSSGIWWLAGICAVLFTLTVSTVRLLLLQKYRRGILGAVVLFGSVMIGVVFGEVLFRQTAPPWPARALHGVSRERWAVAILPGQSGAVATLNLNSWGQRDRERSRLPPPHTRRVAFIGDSFLEEGADQPVSMVTEDKIDSPHLQIVNLGVSATGPDEYFERIRSLSTPLGVSHCYLFLFAGNDFVSPARTLPTYAGVASVEPRPAWLRTLGLAGWNFALTNHQRPVIQAWIEGGQLARDEQQRAAALSQATDDEMRIMLLSASGMQSAAYTRLESVLKQPEMARLFDVFRHPDEGKFRSYYLSAALSAAADASWTWEPNTERVAWEWTELASRYCAQQKIGLSIVLIPEAFQIDDRMWDQWRPLADMRRCTAPCRVAAARFLKQAQLAKLDVIDLHQELLGLRGTYLNMDGHWSELGVEYVSELLAKHWVQRTSLTGHDKND